MAWIYLWLNPYRFIKYNTFSFGYMEYAHEIGNIACLPCLPWFPMKCRCGGLIHAHLDNDGNVHESCDECREVFKEIER